MTPFQLDTCGWQTNLLFIYTLYEHIVSHVHFSGTASEANRVHVQCSKISISWELWLAGNILPVFGQ